MEGQHPCDPPLAEPLLLQATNDVDMWRRFEAPGEPLQAQVGTYVFGPGCRFLCTGGRELSAQAPGRWQTMKCV